MKIQVLSVQITTNPGKTGKPYQVADVAYKNLSFQGKVEGKKVFGFGPTKTAYEILATAQPQDIYDVEVVKNAAGYNDWVSMTKGSAESVNTPAATPAPAAAAGYTQARQSTFETPEERAKKQVYIVRQSSVSNAIAALSCGAKSPPKVGEVIDYAKHLEAYVFDTGVSFPDVPDFPAEAE